MQDENIERKRVPKMDKRTRDRVEALALPTNGQKSLNAGEIWERLDYENYENTKEDEQYIIVSERSIQRYIQKLKEREPENLKFERQPWNMLVNEKAGIPFDPILPRLLRLWFSRHSRHLEHGQGIPFVAFPVGIAKWAVRLHMVAPSLSEKELLYRARQYFAIERIAILAGKLPDSSFDDLEIAMKDESDQGVKAAYEDFCGRRIRPEGQEIQTEDDAVSRIRVSENVVERILSKKRKITKKEE